MAFGHASLPTRKYAYGVREFLPGPRALSPDGGAKLPRARFDGHDAALAQLKLAHQFQNALVALERARRAAADAALRVVCPDLTRLFAEAEAADAATNAHRDALKAANALARERKSDPALVAQVNAAAAVGTAAWRAYSAARRAAFADPAARGPLDAIDAADATAKAAARTAAVAGGLYWATSLQVAPRVKKSGPPPKFKSWDGGGVISVQFQRKPDKSSARVPVLDSEGRPRVHPRSGKPMMRNEAGCSMPVANVGRPNMLCWVERQPVRPPLLPVPSAESGREYVTVHFRVGSDATGAPIWVRLPTVLHRPLPADADVKWVHLSCRRVGTHYKWDVLFDVAKPAWDEHPAGAERATAGAVAVALGWRRIDGAVRVAEWVGTDGVARSVRVPDALVAQWKALDALQGHRDTLFDATHAAVLAWARTQTGDLPAAWGERVVRRDATPPATWAAWAAVVCRWNSPRRLAALVTWWRAHRLPGDADAFAAAEGDLVRNRPAARDRYTGGRKQDRHLADWQANLRGRLLGWRKDFYRKLAIDLSYQYKSVVVAEINWHEIAENPEPEDADELVSKTFRGLAACASLRDCLTHYLDEVKVPAEGIATTCYKCGTRVSPPGRGQWIRCDACGGAKVDRAINAAQILLQRGRAAIADESPARV